MSSTKEAIPDVPPGLKMAPPGTRHENIVTVYLDPDSENNLLASRKVHVRRIKDSIFVFPRFEKEFDDVFERYRR